MAIENSGDYPVHPALLGAGMLNSGLQNAANLYSQLTQLKMQQEALQEKKLESRYDAGMKLMTDAKLPASIKVKAYNNGIRPYLEKLSPGQTMDLTESDFQGDDMQSLIDEIKPIYDSKDYTAEQKKAMMAIPVAKWQSRFGLNKEAASTLLGMGGEDRPAARSYQFAGTDPETGNAVIFDTKTGKFETQNVSGPLAPKTRETKLAPTVINQITEGAAVLRMLPDVSDAIETNQDVFGPVGGRVRKANPYDTKAQTIQAQMKTTSQAFGRFMEGGVLRKEDEIKYEKMFPQLSDTPEVAKKKLAVVNRNLAQRYNDLTSTLKNTGYDTEGLIRSDTPPSALSEKQPSQSSDPRPGTVEGGYRFSGGDPANPANWEKVK